MMSGPARPSQGRGRRHRTGDDEPKRPDTAGAAQEWHANWVLQHLVAGPELERGERAVGACRPHDVTGHDGLGFEAGHRLCRDSASSGSRSRLAAMTPELGRCRVERDQIGVQASGRARCRSRTPFAARDGRVAPSKPSPSSLTASANAAVAAARTTVLRFDEAVAHGDGLTHPACIAHSDPSRDRAAHANGNRARPDAVRRSGRARRGNGAELWRHRGKPSAIRTTHYRGIGDGRLRSPAHRDR